MRAPSPTRLLTIAGLLAAVGALSACATAGPAADRPPRDFAVEVDYVESGPRAGPRRTYALRRGGSAFVIERRTETRHEHLRETPARWAVTAEGAAELHRALIAGGFFSLPSALSPREVVLDCYGWSLTTTAGGRRHTVLVPCTADVPEPLHAVIHAFMEAGTDFPDLTEW